MGGLQAQSGARHLTTQRPATFPRYSTCRNWKAAVVPLEQLKRMPPASRLSAVMSRPVEQMRSLESRPPVSTSHSATGSALPVSSAVLSPVAMVWLQRGDEVSDCCDEQCAVP